MHNEKAIRKAIKSASIIEIQAMVPDNWLILRCSKLGDTVVHCAARHDRIDILQYLEDYYPSLDTIWEAVNAHGKRPLHEAAQSGSVKCTTFLIDKNVQIDCLKQADWTPLMLACTQHNTTIVKMLLDAGADLNLRNKDGWTSFHIACREGKLEIVSCLLENSNSQIWLTSSNNGRTPFHTVALHGRLSLAEWLIDRRYCPALDTTDSCGSTPLMDAIRSGHVTVARLLIGRCKADLRKGDNLGRQCVHIAAQAGCVQGIEFICVESGADVNAVCSDGGTALHLAVWEGHIEVIKQLLRLGANVKLKDVRHRTALDIARLNNAQKSIPILESTPGSGLDM